jgi:amino acid adenylation domain-containing protein
MTSASDRDASARREHALSRLKPAQVEFLRDWNSTSVPYPREATIGSIFEDQAARTPDAVALATAAGDATWTFDALNRSANRLAHHLGRLGIRPETRVGLHLDRSPELIVAMLAVLKSGGAYVPLDPGLPLKRASFVLADASPAVVVSRERLADGLPATTAGLVCLDSDAGAIAACADSNPPDSGSATGLAQILYTSGSTGEPKGVAVVHRGVVRLVKGAGYARFGSDEVFLQAAPASFDASTFEIWGPLLNGGRLVVLETPTPGLEDLAEAIARHGVTTLWLTAGLFHLAVDECLRDLRPLRQLLAGGDVLSVPRVRAALRGLPDCALVNGYGPTEGTTFSACHSIRDLAESASSVPIGRPIANTRIYLLDGEGCCVPPGEEGEIYIGGDGLARGYWKRAALTSESFVESPFEDSSDARLYRTGDLACIGPDGLLEFRGRRDHQVKLHGYRVEPAEIEAALLRHAGVAGGVVEARATTSGARRLVAYVVPRPNGDCDDAGLRAHLQRELPDYMVPAAFVKLHELPLTANGKVDRRALPEPSLGGTGAGEPPRTETEAAIAQVWAAVLEVEAVDCDGNFFDLGGSSLRIIEAHARLQSRLARDLSITALFEHPTVRALARAIDGAADLQKSLRALRDRVRNRAGADPASESAS